MSVLFSSLFVVFSLWGRTKILLTSSILSARTLELLHFTQPRLSWEDFESVKGVQDWSCKIYTSKIPTAVSVSEDCRIGASVHIYSSLSTEKIIIMWFFNIYGIMCRWFHFTLSCIVPILSYLINIHISFKFTSFSSLLPATVNATTPTPPTVITNMPDTNRKDKPNNGKKSCVTFFLVLCLKRICCILRCVFPTIIMSRVMSQFWSHLHWINQD